MPTETPKRIVLTDNPKGIYREFIAGGTIRPGDLVKIYDASGTMKVKAFDAAGTIGEKVFAVEDAPRGNTISDNYAADDRVQVYFAQPGDEIYAWLLAGQSVTVGTDELEPAGDGSLTAVTAETEPAVAVPAETNDNSATGAVDVRIIVRVI